MKLHCEHRIDMSAEAFWGLIHSEAYERRVAEVVGLREYETLERVEDARQVFRRIRVVPAMPARLTALLRRIAGERDSTYFEEQSRSKLQRLVRWRSVPSFLSGRARIEGEVRLEEIDDGHCLRVLDGVVEIRVPGLGLLLERAIASAATEAYAKSAAVANEMARERRGDAPARDGPHAAAS